MVNASQFVGRGEGGSNSERKIGFFSGHSCLWKVGLLPINSE